MKNKNRELFTEAIADAKAIKEMAIANAKQAIAESFTPQIHAMLATKLEEMENEELDENDESTEDEIDEIKKTEEDEEETNESNGSINLDELLAELEEENVEEELNEELDEAKKKEDDEEEIDLESMSSEDLESFIKDVIKDMSASGELESGEEESEDEDEEVTIDEILKSLSEENVEEAGSLQHKKINKKVVDDASNEYYEKHEKVKEELEEATETITELKKTLNEVNLLNSKLLYMNKIFKVKNLNESQKVKVLNSFDKAKTVKESRVVYDLLLESLNDTKKQPIKEHRSIASSVSNGAKSTKKPILENADPLVARWQKIAGIK